MLVLKCERDRLVCVGVDLRRAVGVHWSGLLGIIMLEPVCLLDIFYSCEDATLVRE